MQSDERKVNDERKRILHDLYIECLSAQVVAKVRQFTDVKSDRKIFHI